MEVKNIDNVVYAYLKDNRMYIEYISEETGEVLTDLMWEALNKQKISFDDMLEICKQYEIETGIDCDYRNV